jgi:hypothetical protein
LAKVCASIQQQYGLSLPPGWTRHTFDPQTLSDAEKQGAPDKLSVTTIYKHDSDKNSEFWWPVPTAEERSSEKFFRPRPTSSSSQPAELGFTVLVT